MKKWIFFIAFLVFTGCTQREYTTEVLSAPNISTPTKKPYMVNGNVYHPMDSVEVGWTQQGLASWYGPNFHGKYTSNGELYNMYDFTAAHKTLPMNSIVKVTNLNNGKSVTVRINDRGPFVKGRIIDLSYAAGKQIGLDVTGTAPVRLEVIGFKGRNHVNGYMVQVGAFSKKRGAQITADNYQKLGYNTKIVYINGFYKVFITGFKTYDEAKNFMLSRGIRGFVVGE